MADYYDHGYADPIVDACDQKQHPTSVVHSCSPDPVLTHDGVTSNACRTCPCDRGGHGTHVYGCTAGKGPKVTLEMRIEYARLVRENVDQAKKKIQRNARSAIKHQYNLTEEQAAAL